MEVDDKPTEDYTDIGDYIYIISEILIYLKHCRRA